MGEGSKDGVVAKQPALGPDSPERWSPLLSLWQAELSGPGAARVTCVVCAGGQVPG